MNANRPQRFRPVLRYLVEKSGGYVYPGWDGHTYGQEAWAEPHLQFCCYMDASKFANSVGGRVIKLRVSAALETRKQKKATTSPGSSR